MLTIIIIFLFLFFTSEYRHIDVKTGCSEYSTCELENEKRVKTLKTYIVIKNLLVHILSTSKKNPLDSDQPDPVPSESGTPDLETSDDEDIKVSTPRRSRRLRKTPVRFSTAYYM